MKGKGKLKPTKMVELAPIKKVKKDVSKKQELTNLQKAKKEVKDYAEKPKAKAKTKPKK